MGAMRTVTLNLPEELAARMQTLVETGRYDSVEAVVVAGLEALPEEDETFDRWVLEEAAVAYDRFVAEGSNGVSSEEVAAMLQAHHERRVREARGT